MNNSIQKIYESHHKKSRPENFSILEKERADLLTQNIGKGKKVLDIGCRDGNLTKYFIDGNDVLGVDIDQISLDKANKKYKIRTKVLDLNGSWEELKGEKFDVIVAGEILEHLYFPEKIIGKVKRYLNSDGIFIGSVPNAFSLKNRFRYLFGSKKYTPLSDPTHINQFSYNEIKNILEKEFSDVKVIGLGRFKELAKAYPSFFGFDLFWVCSNY